MKFKDYLAQKGISESDFAEKSADEVAVIYGEYISEIHGKQAKSLDDMKKEMEGFATDEQLKGIQEKVDKQINEMKNLQNAYEKQMKAMKSKAEKSIKDQFKSAFLEKKDELIKLKDSPDNSVIIKAPVPMTFTASVTGDHVARVEIDTERYETPRRSPFVAELVNVGNTNAKTYYYVEKVNREGGATMTAEGAVKPQLDWEYEETSLSPKKLPVIVTISKEMLDDIPNIVNDVYDEIRESIELAMDDQLLNGDGTGDNITGIAENATPFTAGGLANEVTSANKLDVLRAAIAQVSRSEYTPTRIVLSVDDHALLDLQKGDDGHYLMPPFISSGGMVVAGISIVSNTNVPNDTFYVGDFSRYKVKIREGIVIDVGYRGSADDWVKNFVSFRGEMRFFGFIPASHFGAIVSGTFTVAEALLDPDVADS